MGFVLVFFIAVELCFATVATVATVAAVANKCSVFSLPEGISVCGYCVSILEVLPAAALPLLLPIMLY